MQAIRTWPEKIVLPLDTGYSFLAWKLVLSLDAGHSHLAWKIVS